MSGAYSARGPTSAARVAGSLALAQLRVPRRPADRTGALEIELEVLRGVLADLSREGPAPPVCALLDLARALAFPRDAYPVRTTTRAPMRWARAYRAVVLPRLLGKDPALRRASRRCASLSGAARIAALTWAIRQVVRRLSPMCPPPGLDLGPTRIPSAAEVRAAEPAADHLAAERLWLAGLARQMGRVPAPTLLSLEDVSVLELIEDPGDPRLARELLRAELWFDSDACASVAWRGRRTSRPSEDPRGARRIGAGGYAGRAAGGSLERPARLAPSELARLAAGEGDAWLLDLVEGRLLRRVTAKRVAPLRPRRLSVHLAAEDTTASAPAAVSCGWTALCAAAAVAVCRSARLRAWERVEIIVCGRSGGACESSRRIARLLRQRVRSGSPGRPGPCVTLDEGHRSEPRPETSVDHREVFIGAPSPQAPDAAAVRMCFDVHQGRDQLRVEGASREAAGFMVTRPTHAAAAARAWVAEAVDRLCGGE